MNNWVIAEYRGGAVYEPAEGGYYVPVLDCDAVSVKKYSEKHARRAFKKAVAEWSEIYGEPDYCGRYYAEWTTGKYVGDSFEVRMTTNPSIHEVEYHGYC